MSGIHRTILVWAGLALLTGLVAAVMAGVAGPLYKHGAVTLTAAFDLLGKGFWVGVAGAAAGIVGVVAAFFTRRFLAVVLALIGLGCGLGTSLWLHSLYEDAQSVPPIHDVATDPTHPPQFKVLAPERKAAPNGLEYGGGGIQVAKAEQGALAHFFRSSAGRATPGYQSAAASCRQWGPQCLASVQQTYYPHIQPLSAPGVPPSRAFSAALATARAMHWRIVASDAESGHIEATATTAWFGFKDDIAIDVTPIGGGAGSVVNLRSESRLGLSDLGKNAERVRAYLHRLARRLSAATQG